MPNQRIREGGPRKESEEWDIYLERISSMQPAKPVVFNKPANISGNSKVNNGRAIQSRTSTIETRVKTVKRTSIRLFVCIRYFMPITPKDAIHR